LSRAKKIFVAGCPGRTGGNFAGVCVGGEFEFVYANEKREAGEIGQLFRCGMACWRGFGGFFGYEVV